MTTLQKTTALADMARPIFSLDAEEDNNADEDDSPTAPWFTYTSNSPIRVCAICQAPSNGFHFNAPSCSACAAFFRRTVTLNRRFSCAHTSQCKVNFSMRVICRACRYDKCILAGMDRKAVQPRRDCNVGRRKITYAAFINTRSAADLCTSHSSTGHSSSSTISSPITHALLKAETVCHAETPSVQYAISHASSTDASEMNAFSPLSVEHAPSISSFASLSPSVDVLEDLLREERRFNDRRRVLFAGSHTVTAMLLSNAESTDLPFGANDLRELTFKGIMKESRSLILLVNEWVQVQPGFSQMSLSDKKCFLCRVILFICMLDPAFITVQLGLPNKFVMFNGMYVGVDDDTETGWQDEERFITSSMKKELYRPLLERILKQIVRPMAELNFSFVEYVAFKALVSWKSTCVVDFSSSAKERMQRQIDSLLNSLHNHLLGQGMSACQAGERMGSIVLLMSGVLDVGLSVMESHQKIQFFDLWQLDSLLLQMLSRKR